MKRQSTVIAFSILALTLSFSCTTYKKASSSKSTFQLATAKGQIEEINQNYMELVARGDSTGVANLYSADARLFLSGRPVVVGRANIQTAFSHLLNSGVTKLNIETIEVFGSEDLLAEEGHVTIYVKSKAVADEKSIIIWKKEDGKWKIFRDIANPNSK